MVALLNEKKAALFRGGTKIWCREHHITHSFCRNEAHLNHGNNIYSKWHVCNFTTGSKNYSLSFLPDTQQVL